MTQLGVPRNSRLTWVLDRKDKSRSWRGVMSWEGDQQGSQGRMGLDLEPNDGSNSDTRDDFRHGSCVISSDLSGRVGHCVSYGCETSSWDSQDRVRTFRENIVYRFIVTGFSLNTSLNTTFPESWRGDESFLNQSSAPSSRLSCGSRPFPVILLRPFSLMVSGALSGVHFSSGVSGSVRRWLSRLRSKVGPPPSLDSLSSPFTTSSCAVVCPYPNSLDLW